MLPTISSPGIGSGLNINGIIDSLMALERQPLLRLQGKETDLRAQLSAVGQLKSAMSTFQGAMEDLSSTSKFKVYSATPSDATILAATASSSAAKGSYTVLVERIAENHRRAANTQYANTDTTTIGTAGDTMTITVGTDAFNVSIGGKTLGQIRDAINDAADNAGVTASIIKDSGGYRLLLSSDETGSTSALTVGYSGADPFALQTLNADRDGSGGFTSADLDAKLLLEGQFALTSTSNTLTDTIQGVTLTLKKAGSVTLAVDRDTDAVTESVQDFAKSYSDLLATVKTLRTGVLKNQGNMLLGIESGLRNILSSSVTVNGSYSLLSQVGVETQNDGSLSVDTDVLSTALQTDFSGVAALFSQTSNGFAVKLEQLADAYLDIDGVIDTRTDGLDAAVRRNEDQQIAMESRLEAIRARYVRQYSALDSLLATLQSTGNFLTQQLSTLSRNTGNRR